MDRRTFMQRSATALSVVPAAVVAQRSAKTWRIGTLRVVALGPVGAFPANFHAALAELGYIAGRNVSFIDRSAEGVVDRLPKLAAELVALGVDVIVTGGSEATRAAKQATSSIPIVFSGPSYPVEEGLVASFARPGGNVTGITIAMSDTVAKHLQLLREVVPSLTSVAVVWSPANPGHTHAFRDTETVGASMRIKVESAPLAIDDPQPALLAIDRLQPGALIVQPAPPVNPNVRRFSELALKQRIPSITINRDFAASGLLMSYGADFAQAPRRVAALVDRILKGAKPAELPVERPTRFELVINMRTAKALGLVIPQSLLARADDILH